jgi:hypothetical protein
LQVLHAVSAHFHSNQMAWGEPSPPSMENRLFVTSPSTMQGLRCYTDASTTPDLLSNGIRPAGIGIFITNTVTPDFTRKTECISYVRQDHLHTHD